MTKESGTSAWSMYNADSLEIYIYNKNDFNVISHRFCQASKMADVCRMYESVEQDCVGYIDPV